MPDFEIVHSADRGDERVDEETGIHQFFAENLQEMMGGAGGTGDKASVVPSIGRSTGFNEVIEDADVDDSIKSKSKKGGLAGAANANAEKRKQGFEFTKDIQGSGHGNQGREAAGGTAGTAFD